MPAAGLYPRSSPRPTPSRAEVAFYNALATHLPEGWIAWHSLRVRTEREMEGEGDFILAIPDVGVILIEVKGGAIELRDGHWYQSGRRMTQAPRQQAHELRGRLYQKLVERGIDPPPYMFIVTAFPDTIFAAPPTAGDLDDAVLGQQDLPFLADRLNAIAAHLISLGRFPRCLGWEGALHDLWGETWVPSVGLAARVRHREAELVALDRDQLAILDQTDGSHRLLVQGGPGTGKTLVAAELVRRWEKAGRSPVFLCFTRALATALADQVPRVASIRDLAADVVRRSGSAVQGDAAEADWTSETWATLPLRAAELWPGLGDRARAVVVDEAQDLSPEDWVLVRAVAGDGPLWAFADEGQSFLSEPRGVPDGLFQARITLRARYRCPEDLAAFADEYRAAGATAHAPWPSDLALVVARAEQAERTAADYILALLAHDVRPEQIAVLSLAGQTRTSLARQDQLGEVAVVRADDPRSRDHVVADTFLRFKGLERPYVIVTELRLTDDRYDVRMHIALTRATVGCVIIATEADVAKDPRLQRGT